MEMGDLMRRAALPAIIIGCCVAGPLSLAGCGSDNTICGKLPAADEAIQAPRVTSLNLLDNAVPGDPWDMVFAIGFRDHDGDLGLGHGLVYLGNAGHATDVELLELFRQSGLAYTSTSGQLTMPLRFDSSVPDGTSAHMALVLLDEAKRRSNCYEMNLSFHVEATGAATPRQPSSLWAELRSALGRLWYDG
jgi:hypothetical protein